MILMVWGGSSDFMFGFWVHTPLFFLTILHEVVVVGSSLLE